MVKWGQKVSAGNTIITIAINSENTHLKSVATERSYAKHNYNILRKEANLSTNMFVYEYYKSLNKIISYKYSLLYNNEILNYFSNCNILHKI
jgi:hypothetical protein